MYVFFHERERESVCIYTSYETLCICMHLAQADSTSLLCWGNVVFLIPLLVYELVQESIFSFQFFMAFDWECITTMEGTMATMVLQDSNIVWILVSQEKSIPYIPPILNLLQGWGCEFIGCQKAPQVAFAFCLALLFCDVFWWRIDLIGLGSWIFSPGFFKVLDLRLFDAWKK